jgi:hypothetical protein
MIGRKLRASAPIQIAARKNVSRPFAAFERAMTTLTVDSGKQKERRLPARHRSGPRLRLTVTGSSLPR